MGGTVLPGSGSTAQGRARDTLVRKFYAVSQEQNRREREQKRLILTLNQKQGPVAFDGELAL